MELHAYQDEKDEFTAVELSTHDAVALTDEAEELEILCIWCTAVEWFIE